MKNVVWHHAAVTRQHRNEQNNYKSVVLWFTGLSGSGKSTLAHAVEEGLHQIGCRAIVLDGDNIRHGLCKDLGFSDKNRKENIRRIGEVAKLFIKSSVITLTAFILPFKEDRDVKGLYMKVKSHEIQNFTGISSPYEVSRSPDLIVDTSQETLNESVDKVLDVLINKVIIKNAN